ncbi:ferritin-like domain-containing protein [Lenzites betulinus]|nr:ferritin-like domain-containing protein [Lenzites betulinus]
MFRKAILLAFLSAVSVLGASDWTDTTTSEYLLTLKQAESAFFSQGLQRFSVSDFTNAGYLPWVRSRFVQIAAHESTHVTSLTNALGNAAPAPCTYDFGLTDVASFIDLAQRFTTIDASANLGALPLVADSADLLTSVGSTAAAESRQAAWITASVQKRQPWNKPFETPLDPDAAYSLFLPYIDQCPDTNADLPFHSYPALTVYPGYPTVPGTVSVSLTLKAAAAKYYLAWLDGLAVKYSLITSGQAPVPAGLDGTVYVAVVKTQEPPSAANLVSGFAVVQFPFDSHHQAIPAPP